MGKHIILPTIQFSILNFHIPPPTIFAYKLTRYWLCIELSDLEYVPFLTKVTGQFNNAPDLMSLANLVVTPNNISVQKIFWKFLEKILH